jgi:hypothetical protein
MCAREASNDGRMQPIFSATILMYETRDAWSMK